MQVKVNAILDQGGGNGMGEVVKQQKHFKVDRILKTKDCKIIII